MGCTRRTFSECSTGARALTRLRSTQATSLRGRLLTVVSTPLSSSRAHGSANISVRAHEGTESGCLGHGVAAWKALKERFDARNKKARRSCREQPYSGRFKSGGDPINFFAAMDDLKLGLSHMDEQVSEEVYLDIILKAISHESEFKFIWDMHYRQPSPSVEDLKRTAMNYYIDEQSRTSSSPAVSGRGAAMAAASSTDQCKAFGHYKRDCPTLARKSRPKQWKKGKKRSGDPSPKWCSLHKTNKHGDAECHTQKELRGLAANLALLQPSNQARFTNVGSAHLAQPPQVEPSTFGFSFSAMGASLAEAATSFSASGTPTAAPASAPTETPLQDHHLPHVFFGAFMATSADLSDPHLHSDGLFVRMLVDSGATYNFVDPSLTPWLRDSMRDIEVLQVPHMIVAAGQHLLKGVEAGTILGTVTDDGGKERPISFAQLWCQA